MSTPMKLPTGMRLRWKNFFCSSLFCACALYYKSTLYNKSSTSWLLQAGQGVLPESAELRGCPDTIAWDEHGLC